MYLELVLYPIKVLLTAQQVEAGAHGRVARTCTELELRQSGQDVMGNTGQGVNTYPPSKGAGRLLIESSVL